MPAAAGKQQKAWFSIPSSHFSGHWPNVWADSLCIFWGLRLYLYQPTRLNLWQLDAGFTSLVAQEHFLRIGEICVPNHLVGSYGYLWGIWKDQDESHLYFSCPCLSK